MMFPSIKTLFDAETLDGLSPEGVTAFYLGGWFLVHTMARYYPMQLGDLLARLADGQWIRDAFFGAFGPDSWKELDAHYAAVVREAYQLQPGRIVVPSWRKPYRPPATVVGVTGEREVDDGALHLLWADLELGRHDIAPQVALAAAHGGDSAQLAYMRGIVALQRQDLAAAERDLTAAVDARPDEERYHLTLARMRAGALVRDRPHTLDAMAHDMEWLGANAKSADAHALVALYYGLRGDFVTAGKQAQRSLDLDPTCARGYLAVALLAEQRGDVDAALVAAERSVRLTPPVGARNAEALQLLAGLRARSRARSPLQPPSLRLQVPALRR
jgi:tetratricopeptide (TPR) repeat protein